MLDIPVLILYRFTLPLSLTRMAMAGVGIHLHLYQNISLIMPNIGDVPGITKKLDYLKDLGVDVIWVSPSMCTCEYMN